MESNGRSQIFERLPTEDIVASLNDTLLGYALIFIITQSLFMGELQAASWTSLPGLTTVEQANGAGPGAAVADKGVVGWNTGKARAKGVLIILDPGHGGEVDSGSTVAEITEDEFAYDIAVRVRKHLLREGYHVHTTVYDADTAYEPQSRLVNGSNEYLLYADGRRKRLTEPFLNERCRLITQAAAGWRRSILVSIHIDSRFSMLRGLAVYVPDQRAGLADKTLQASQTLAQDILGTVRQSELQTFSIDVFGFRLAALNSIRTTFRKNIVPAIFRYTDVSAKVLIECGNLRNTRDLGGLAQAKQRQQLADGIAIGIMQHVERE